MIFMVILAIWILLGSLALWARAKPMGANIFVGAAVLAIAQIIGVMLLAGLLGWLHREVIIGAHVALSAVLILWGRANWAEQLPRWRSGVSAAWREIRQSPVALTLLVVVSVVGLIILGLGWLFPPTDFDGLAQHIPIASFYLQNGNIATIDTPYRGIRAYPAAGSLLMAWSMLVANSDVAVDLVQWPFWLMGTVALYKIARTTGASRANAVIGCAVFTLAPIVLLQARAAYVDLALAGLTLCALALLVDSHLPVRWGVIGTSCALGILIGLKYAGLIYAVLLGIGLLIRLWSDRRDQWRAGLIDAGSATLLVVGLGGYWYIRNWIGLNNPVWPMTLQVGGWRIFDGVWTTATFYQDALPPALTGLSYPLQLWSVWRETVAQFTADMRLGGLGPVWLAIGLPCFAIYLVRAIRMREWLVVALLGFAIAAFIMTPVNWYTRYVIAPVAISGVAIALVLGKLDRWPCRFLQGLTMVLSLYGVGWALLNGPISPADFERFVRLPTAERRTIFVDQVAAVGPAMRWFGQNVSLQAVIAYGWQGVILFPFWEGAPQRQMIYVPAGDPPTWFDTLRDRGAEYLLARQNSAEAQAAARDIRFHPVYIDEAYAIYTLP